MTKVCIGTHTEYVNNVRVLIFAYVSSMTFVQSRVSFRCAFDFSYILTYIHTYIHTYLPTCMEARIVSMARVGLVVI